MYALNFLQLFSMVKKENLKMFLGYLSKRWMKWISNSLLGSLYRPESLFEFLNNELIFNSKLWLWWCQLLKRKISSNIHFKFHFCGIIRNHYFVHHQMLGQEVWNLEIGWLKSRLKIVRWKLEFKFNLIQSLSSHIFLCGYNRVK